MSKTIDRRTLLKVIGGTCFSAGMPMTITPALAADPDRFWVMVNAGGGWDPTLFIDPKGDIPRADGRGPVNNYSTNVIRSAGNISYAGGYAENSDVPETSSPGHLDTFFQKHSSRLLVINGIDTQTNNHDAGSRFIWSGKIESGYPSFGALVAASTAPEQPLSFISNGGYDFTASLVAPARVAGSSTFQQLAYPNAASPHNEPEKQNPYFNDVVYEKIEAARAARLGRLIRRSTLPLETRQLEQLQTVRGEDNNLNRLVDALPERVSNGLAGQAEIAVASFTSGLAVSANLSMGGFDTHGNHDRDHGRRLTELLTGIDHLWEQIEASGLQNKVTVVVGSDFGRTPFYNSNRGKDHWNVTSVMAMGAGVRGNRVIGGTDANFEALPINPQSLKPDANGIILTPEHLHLALRDLADVSSDLTSQFGIQGQELNLFS
jgi:hypothetical protein